LGGRRGRLIEPGSRNQAVHLIDETVFAGAALGRACAELQISRHTYYRWKTGSVKDRRKGARKSVPRKLTTEERQEIIAVCTSKEYRDLTPYEIYVILLDIDIYKASISTFYRVLRERDLIHHRSSTRPARQSSRPPERLATGPNQVWAWDITYLKRDVKGLYLFLYSIIDVWSRKLVGWTIANSESPDVAEHLFARIVGNLHISEPLYLHSDNGNAMKAETLLMTLHRLNVIPSRSRPRVSDDNAFIESFFKTLKYVPHYPGYFTSIESANAWVADFISWYNTVHLHSGIGYVTPVQKHTGQAEAIIAHRNEVKRNAYTKLCYRWSKAMAPLTTPQFVYLNPSLETRKLLASGL